MLQFSKPHFPIVIMFSFWRLRTFTVSHKNDLLVYYSDLDLDSDVDN